MKSMGFITQPRDKKLLQKFHLEKLIVAQLLNKFPAFHGSGSYITLLTGTCQQALLSLDS